ncbi:hypothetical protein VKT23_001710 [Stygiomarasmius scandens]|uniref:Uncharacterized protein n=1 Tax=Marasmiellus scandens TaxID=2682957 RepID=A0ABR1JZQ9_9AGAR
MSDNHRSRDSSRHRGRDSSRHRSRDSSCHHSRRRSSPRQGRERSSRRHSPSNLSTTRRDSSLPPSSIPPSSSPARSRSPDHSNVHMKRTIDHLTRELEKVQGKGRSRGKTNRTLGRGIRKVAALFNTIPALVAESDRRALDDEGEDQYESELDEDTLTDNQKNERQQKRDLRRVQDRKFQGFQLLCETVPGFRKMIDSDVPVSELLKYYSDLEQGANAARNDDVNNAKEEIVDWLNARPNPPHPPLARKTRVGRGFRNLVTGRLLCPIDLDWNDAQTRADIQRRKLSVNKTEYFFCIRALYHREVGDPNDVEGGFLKGELLVKMFKLVFTSASSNDEVSTNGFEDSEIDNDNDDCDEPPAKRRRPTRKNVAQLLNMTSVTPRAIAYTAVMLRFALSDAKSWGSDRSFNYEGFYNAIVDYFEDVKPDSDEQQSVKELLEWWNRKIFPDCDDNASTSSKPLQDFKNILAAQRAAKAAARKIAEQPSYSNDGFTNPPATS